MRLWYGRRWLFTYSRAFKVQLVPVARAAAMGACSVLEFLTPSLATGTKMDRLKKRRPMVSIVRHPPARCSPELFRPYSESRTRGLNVLAQAGRRGGQYGIKTPPDAEEFTVAWVPRLESSEAQNHRKSPSPRRSMTKRNKENPPLKPLALSAGWSRTCLD